MAQTTQSTTISCVYDLLQKDSTSTWYDDGTIVVNRPAVNVNLENVKFRSFSANVKSSLQNLTSPQINAKLCANFTWYTPLTTPITPPSSATTDVIEDSEILITPDVTSIGLDVYNQTGHQHYEAANGIYHNDVNNEIVLSEFTIPLVTSFQDSVNDMFKYSRYLITKLLGIYDDSEINKNLYNTSTFVYGEVNTKPYVPELGSYKWINSAHDLSCSFKNDTLKFYSLTYDEGVMDPNLVVGGYQYDNVNMTPTFDTYMPEKMRVPFGFFRSFTPVRNSASKYFVLGINCKGSNPDMPKVSSPWVGMVSLPNICDPLNASSPLDINVGILGTSSNLIITESIAQNSESYIMSFYSYDDGTDTDIAGLKDRISFNSIYKDHGANIGARFTSIIKHNNELKYLSFIYLQFNNPTTEFDEQLGIMEDDGYFLLSYTAIDYTESMENNDWRVYLFLAFTNNVYIKILRFEIDAATASYSFNSNTTFPKLKDITTIKLSKRFAYVDHEWNVDNYLEFLSDLNNVNVPNAPMLILPKYTDGTNDAMTIYYNAAGKDNIVFNYRLMDESTEGGNIWYSNNTIYTSRYKGAGTDAAKAEISMCRTINVILDDSGEHMNIGVSGTICLNNYLWSRWWAKRYELYGRDITSYVKNYNLKFPIVNVLSTFTFDATILDDSNKQPVNETDSLVWLVDATGAQVYIKDQTFENIYSFAQSALTVKVKTDTTEHTLSPQNPVIGEPDSISSTTYSWVNTKHITKTPANPYFYAAESSYSFIDNTFKVNADDGTVTFPCVPVVDAKGTESGLLTFFVKFTTMPEILTFDPNTKQSERFANRYNFCKQFINKTPSLYNDKYPFDAYLFYNNETLYNNVAALLELNNRDLTLKLKCTSYPSTDGIIFYLNETSMVDFKECRVSQTTDKLIFYIYDADEQILTPTLARKIYANVNLCLDWQFSN